MSLPKSLWAAARASRRTAAARSKLALPLASRGFMSRVVGRDRSSSGGIIPSRAQPRPASCFPPLAIPRNHSITTTTVTNKTCGRVNLTSLKTLVHVAGRDAAKLLNGLFTLQVSKDASTPFSGQFGAFLNGKGRVIADAFLYTASNHSPETQSYVLEFDRSVEAELVEHLQRHKLRAKARISVLPSEDYEVHFFWNHDSTPDYYRSDNDPDQDFFQSLYEVGMSVAEVAKQGEAGEAPAETSPDTPPRDPPLFGLLLDDRHPLFGVRMIMPAGTANAYYDAIPEANQTDYKVQRYIRGIPEGAEEIVPNRALPMESDLDYMNGLDFNRGCYVGQELTIRTHHTGVVRKRLVPFQLYSEDSEPADNEAAYNNALSEVLPPMTGVSIISLNSPEAELAPSPFGPSKKTAGKPAPLGNVLSHVGNIGMALVRLDKVMEQQDIELAVEMPGPDGQIQYLRAKLFYPLFVADVGEAEAEKEAELEAERAK